MSWEFELSRIRTEMQAIIDALDFDGDFKAFVDFLREDPSFYAKTDQELLGRAALISKTAEGELPRSLRCLPRSDLQNPRGDSNRGAMYMPPSGDGTDSGTYFVKIGDLKSEPLYALESLSLHEGVPGHHLQSTLAQELDVHSFGATCTIQHSAKAGAFTPNGLVKKWVSTRTRTVISAA